MKARKYPDLYYELDQRSRACFRKRESRRREAYRLQLLGNLRRVIESTFPKGPEQ